MCGIVHLFCLNLNRLSDFECFGIEFEFLGTGNKRNYTIAGRKVDDKTDFYLQNQKLYVMLVGCNLSDFWEYVCIIICDFTISTKKL